jgi:sugar lactone lactonase YvrE
MMRWLLILGGVLLGALVLGLVAAALWMRLTFGGGADYPDLTGEPLLGADALEAVVAFDRPIGNVAVASDGAIYFTIHPESHPEPPFLHVWRDGEARPFPDEGQDALFSTPLGLVIDDRDRLWVIDPAEHGGDQPRLVALDTASCAVVYQHAFDREIAPPQSFLQDLAVSADGRLVYIADVGFWSRRPALVVHDVETGRSRRLMERHPAFTAENWLIRNHLRDMRYLGGLLEMKTGLDGVALSRDGDWLYLAAMNHEGLYRLPTALASDFSAAQADISAGLEHVSQKPLNDGLSTDETGRVYITDVEHGAVMRWSADAGLETLVRDDRIRWADALSFGPEGGLYIADSAIPLLVLQGPAEHAAAAPYTIWRVQTDARPAPGR